jgi:phage baseplate assembly protein W
MNLLDRFNQQIVGSQAKIFDYTSKISPSGDFSKIRDIEVILSSWNNILLTPCGTYPFDNEFGSNLMNYIFEPADTGTAEMIKNEIRHKLSKYDDRATITSIQVNFLNSQKGFNVDIDIVYNGEKALLSATISESLYFQFLRQ